MYFISFQAFLCGAALFAFAAVASADAEYPTPLRSPALFVDAAEWEDPGAAVDPTVMRGRPVEIDFEPLLQAARRPDGTVAFELFDDAWFTGIVERAEVRSPDSYTFIGRLLDEPNSSFTLVVRKQVMVANVRVPSRGTYYQIRYLGQGVHVVRQIDESKFPPCTTGTEHAAPMPAQAASGGEPARGCDDDGSVIDVLVVYTPLARQAVGGTEAMEALINLAVAESNTAYANSLIGTQLSLVYKSEIDYVESDSYSGHLYRLTDPDDGYMDEVHRLRDEYRADMVTLLVDDSSYCGVAWVMQELTLDFEAYAFNVVTHSCATGYYSFSHELGHNMGCAHDRANASVAGLYEFSYGYQDPDEVFRSVMAYNCPGGCTRVDHFSNPDVTYSGLPTGVPVTEADAAHNTLTINLTADTVANFRKSRDCNDNGVCDDVDIAGGTSEDCNDNGTPDECEFDCNNTGVPDDCDIMEGTSEDCNDNGVPDECIELEVDCNENAVPDECDISSATSRDCNNNGVPDDCEGDCNNNGTSDYCDVLDGLSPDENDNGYPDECEPPILFVDADAVGLNNGQGWTNAFNELQDALRIAGLDRSFVEEVWVAAGTYRPSEERDPGSPRTATFQLISGMGIYGGFAGGEISRHQRDPDNNVTILSGDLNGDDGPYFANNVENAYHVVTASNTDESAVLDGFTITGGNASGPYDGPYLNGYNSGGGMFIRTGSPTLVNLVFTENTTSGFASHGGGLTMQYAVGPTLIGCSFIGNTAQYSAGMNIGGRCTVTLINCTFIENRTVG